MQGPIRVVLRRGVTCVTAVVMVWLMTLPAAAAELPVRDRTGDMWKQNSFNGDFTRAPKMSNMDYVRARFVHTNRRVIFQGKFVQLRQPTRQIFSMYTAIRDQDGNRWQLSMAADSTGSDSGLLTWRGRELRCDVTHRVNYRRNTIRMSLPRRCLDRPRSLQFHAASSFAPRPRGAFFIDDLLSGRGTSRGWTPRVRAS